MNVALSNDAVNLELHEKQSTAFESQGTEILYGGAAGGGKSHLFRAAAITWCSEIPDLQVYIFRRKFPDLYKNHMEGPTGFPSLLMPWVNQGFVRINYGANQIKFWNNAKIHLCHCQNEADVYGYQGAEIHVLMPDELTHFTEFQYRYLRGRVRIGGLKVPVKYSGRFPRILAGSNPGGIGHNWVKATFIAPQEPLALVRQPKEEGGLLRQFIPAKLEDNPTLMENDPDYIDRLSGLGSEALVKAMRDGDWNIVAGGAFDDVWSDRIKVPRFKVPSSWRVDRSFDWGSAKPFSVLFFAECDGTEATLPSGRKFCPPKGSLVVIDEWYGAKGPNQGLKMSAKNVAKGIIDKEATLKGAKWIEGRVRPGPADNAIADEPNPDSPSIATVMGMNGVRWLRSNKSPGSRKGGLTLVRGMLEEAGKDHPESPCLYIMNNCRQLLDHLPVLQRDPRDEEDVDTKAEDHDWDALRYRALKGSGAAEELQIKLPS